MKLTHLAFKSIKLYVTKKNKTHTRVDNIKLSFKMWLALYHRIIYCRRTIMQGAKFQTLEYSVVIQWICSHEGTAIKSTIPNRVVVIKRVRIRVCYLSLTPLKYLVNKITVRWKHYRWKEKVKDHNRCTKIHNPGINTNCPSLPTNCRSWHRCLLRVCHVIRSHRLILTRKMSIATIWMWGRHRHLSSPKHSIWYRIRIKTINKVSCRWVLQSSINRNNIMRTDTPICNNYCLHN